MHTWISSLVALFASAQAHSVIIDAQGEAGSPSSVGFQVDSSIARNCTLISPCQQDTTIIRDAEINSNVTGQCGRTELDGNIDVSANTESAITAGQVTQVKAATTLTITVHQVNQDGAGPYFCDLYSSDSSTDSEDLTVTNNVPGSNGLSQAKASEFNVTVQMPASFNCTGGSTENVCIVRCRNNALAGPFGGCFAVQQIAG
ncbi:gegh 16 protein [Pleurostoma richardsiae]|uniref:Gegh 16 protein n=1 Tax=Pleurostoma richardsiae TaxID=41990 RepID=A0AA38S581_9PEZI|nr:gegh 16 protein [Pleurostoma richardsiae]